MSREQNIYIAHKYFSIFIERIRQFGCTFTNRWGFDEQSNVDECFSNILDCSSQINDEFFVSVYVSNTTLDAQMTLTTTETKR